MTELESKSYEFFKLFARAEYSLKVSGYNCGDGNASAKWDSFAEDINDSFINVESEDFIEALKYIDENPPNKQVIKNGVIEWSNTVPESICRADLILLYVRRVRNSLFHGGKFNGNWFAPARSKELLVHSTIILNKTIGLSPKVKSAYNG